MSAPSPSPARDSRRTHRIVVVTAGALALVGAALAAFVAPTWAALAAVGGVLLLVYPDSK